MNETAKYHLKKPSPEDFYDVADKNANMDAIDTALAAHDGELAKKADLDENGKVPEAQLPKFSKLAVGETADTAYRGDRGKLAYEHSMDSAKHITQAERTKLTGIAEGANKTVVDAALSGTSENPVQNKAVSAALEEKASRAELAAGLGGKADLVGGKVPAGQLPAMDYDPAGSAAGVQGKLDAHVGNSTNHITSAERVKWNAKLDTSQKGIANGVATLGSDGKVPASQLQASTETLNFGKSNGENGLWDRLETAPAGTSPIRYNGYLRATRVYGVYYSDSADFAEAYEISGSIEPGEVATLCEDGFVRKSTVPGDIHALGIVSTDPAHVIGGQGIPIALSGRVPVKVVGKVKAGDYLTSSEIPGCACATDAQKAPRGSLIGMALEEKTSEAAGRITAFVLRL